MSRAHLSHTAPSRHSMSERASVPSKTLRDRPWTEATQSADTVLTNRMEFRVRGPLSLLEPVLSRLLAKDSRRDE